MMAAILKSAIFDSAILHKKLHSFILTQLDDGSLLVFCHLGFWHLVFFSEIHSKTLSLSALTLTQTNSIWLKLIHSDSTWWWQPSWFLPIGIQPSLFSLLNSLTLAKICSHNLHKKKHFTYSFWLNLMIAAILNSAMLDSDTAILDSDTLLSSLRFTQKHSHSTLTLTQTNSIWLTWWWQPSWILPSWIQPFCTKLWLNLIQSDSNHSFWLILMMAAILNSVILDSDILHKITFTWSFWLTLMMAAILNSAILDSDILHKITFTWSFWLTLMMAAILNSAILDSAILHKKLHLFILTQLDDGSHLEFCHVVFSDWHLGFRHLVIFSQIYSKTLSLHSDSDWNLFNLTQNYSF